MGTYITEAIFRGFLMPYRTWLTVMVLMTVLAGGVLRAAPKAGGKQQITLERLLQTNDFGTESGGMVRWTGKQGEYYTFIDSEGLESGKDLVKKTAGQDGYETIVTAGELIPKGQTKPLGIADFSLSRDGKKLLIFTNTKRVWRMNTRGDYWVYDLRTKMLRQLGGEAAEASLMFAKFSPDGRQVGYVREHNIYVQELEHYRIRQITRDGSETIINGTGDWVNEEELYIRDGFRWSPDSRYIAYWQFDTSGVERFTLVNYTEGLYPKLKQFPYPKAGQRNSATRIGVAAVRSGQTAWVKLEGDAREHYIAALMWRPGSSELIIEQLNRLQNTNRYWAAKVDDRYAYLASIREVREVFRDVDRAWVWASKLVWLKGNRDFLVLSERDGWQHIYQVSSVTGESRLVSPGDYDVLSIEGLSADEKEIYVIASPENGTQRYLYQVSRADGKKKRITPAQQSGTHSYRIAEGGRWAVHSYSRFGQPPVTELVALPEHRTVEVLADNDKLVKTLKKLERCEHEFFQVEADGVRFDGWCIKPPHFDAKKRYPLLMHVYGEPAGQTVLDKWGGRNYLWHTMLAQQGFVVASIDNRGTPSPRGRFWRKCIYRQVGILAPRDQAHATRAFMAERKWIDPKRVGIWGWSGGGSMTLHAMLQYPDLYRVGVAVAFVADMRFYDTIYQERYMGLPADNPIGYEQGAPLTHAEKLKGDLLLCYGTGDDNTHYQSCATLVNRLIKAGKRFTQQIYPNRTHGISEGAGTRLHLYRTMTDYLMTHLKDGTAAKKAGGGKTKARKKKSVNDR